MKRFFKITIYFCFLLFAFCSTNAQVNLVNNGYFEIYDTCPNYASQITRATGWLKSSLTPDYYNSCPNVNSSNGINVPNAMFGYQKDCCGGAGFAGGFMFDKNSSNNSNRDYINTKLTNTLTAGHKYIAKMYISRGQAVDYAVTTIGMLFTDTITTLPAGQGFISANPQIKNTTLLSDTLNWMGIQDTFIAIGNESYLTIGNFNTTATSDTAKLTNYWSTFPIAYYYIDGVSVYEIDGTCNNYWNAGFDKYIHSGDSIMLGAINTDNSTYTWVNSIGGATHLSNNTDARPYSKPTQTTTYYVTKTCPNNNTFIDTVTVYVQPTVGIKQVTNSLQVNIYPNPANNKIHIDAKEVKEVKLFDLLGNEIITTKEKEIDVSNLREGIYFIQVNTNGRIYTKKIIVQH